MIMEAMMSKTSLLSAVWLCVCRGATQNAQLLITVIANLLLVVMNQNRQQRYDSSPRSTVRVCFAIGRQRALVLQNS